METITPLIQDYIVDFASNNNFFFIKGIQGDGYGTRYARISLSNNGQPYIINQDAIRAVIRGTKPDTKQIFNTCEIIDESTIQFELTNQMLAVAGKGEYEISIMSTTENRTLTSFPFFVITSQSSFDASYVTSSDEFTLLISKINQVDVLIDDTEKTIEEAENVIKKCEESIYDCEEATSNAEIAITDLRKLESEIKVAEDARINAEEARVQAEINREINVSNAISEMEQKTANVISDAETATLNANNATSDLRYLEENLNEAENNRVIAEAARVEAENKREENVNSALSQVETATNNANSAAENSNNKTLEMQGKIDEYNLLNLPTVTQNAIDATNNTNIAITNAEKATSDANYAAEEARKAIENIQDAIGIDDSKESLTTAWSSTHTHEVIIQEIGNNMIPVTTDAIDSLFIEE